MAEIVPGTRVVAEGPFGVFTDLVRRRDRLLLIAGGIGITPVRALMDELAGDLVVIYRVLREDDLVFRSELEQVAQRRGIAVHFLAGDHATAEGARLLTPEHLKELVPDVAHREVYLCGPPAMANALERLVRRVGIPRKLVHVERFAL